MGLCASALALLNFSKKTNAMDLTGWVCDCFGFEFLVAMRDDLILAVEERHKRLVESIGLLDVRQMGGGRDDDQL